MHVVSTRRIILFAHTRYSGCVCLQQKSIIDLSLGICKWNMRHFISKNTYFSPWRDQSFYAKKASYFSFLKKHLPIVHVGYLLLLRKPARGEPYTHKSVSRWSSTVIYFFFSFKPTYSVSIMQLFSLNTNKLHSYGNSNMCLMSSP